MLETSAKALFTVVSLTVFASVALAGDEFQGMGVANGPAACVAASLDGGRTADFQAATASIRPLWRSLHWLGHGPVYLVLVFVLAMGRHWRRALDFAVAMGLSAWSIGVMKAWFHAPRPGWVGETLWVDVPSLSTGFPSGHAATVMGLLLLVRSKSAMIGVGLFCGLMAVSRVGVGAHSPAQVLAGVGVGTLVVIVSPVIGRSLVSGWGRVQFAMVMVVTVIAVWAVLGLPLLGAAGGLCHSVSGDALVTATDRTMGGGLGLLLGALTGGILVSPGTSKMAGYAVMAGALFVALLGVATSAQVPLVINTAGVAAIWAVAMKWHRVRRRCG